MFSNISRNCNNFTSRQLVFHKFKRGLNSNIPHVPVIPPKYPGKVTITEENIRHLERLSLVDFANVEGIRRLEEAIEFAQPIKEVNTEGIEPMYTVLDDATLFLGIFLKIMFKFMFDFTSFFGLP